MKFLLALIFFCSISVINNVGICSAQQLINELIEDLADNGKLDCLINPLPAPRDRQESDEDRKKRIDAAWDSDCSFEADYDWMKIAKERFALQSGLVDRDGKAVDYPFDKQADFCELIRAMIVGGVFEGQKIEDLNEDSFQGIECPGPADQDLQICAATSGSAAQKYSWVILLEPSSVQIKENNRKAYPNFILDVKSKAKLKDRKGE